MRVALLGMRVFVVPVRVAAVAMVVEKEETDDVRQETAGTDDENDHGMRDVLRFDESLDGFEEDGET
jgi:D-alanine-D-alanine ligase-like ATP-grasp enzyme